MILKMNNHKGVFKLKNSKSKKIGNFKNTNQ